MPRHVAITHTVETLTETALGLVTRISAEHEPRDSELWPLVFAAAQALQHSPHAGNRIRQLATEVLSLRQHGRRRSDAAAS